MGEPDTQAMLEQARQLRRARAEELGMPAPDPDQEIVLLVDEVPQALAGAAGAPCGPTASELMQRIVASARRPERWEHRDAYLRTSSSLDRPGPL
ncbi:hypothetical protein [Saccharopolyspora taberi]|uniref:Uncharacterized protein n=1 Tax=Saccharopolyspora taberi TaxID=60895 RepID=A0ABN3V8L0_9PSEU